MFRQASKDGDRELNDREEKGQEGGPGEEMENYRTVDQIWNQGVRKQEMQREVQHAYHREEEWDAPLERGGTGKKQEDKKQALELSLRQYALSVALVWQRVVADCVHQQELEALYSQEDPEFGHGFPLPGQQVVADCSGSDSRKQVPLKTETPEKDGQQVEA